ncbi:GNAT family N-acetyltransferase [Catenuloplanes sp. NPDC051500]|uniref:GNAT family N-acetyltransferase n=1 Tax=Catenuloplanes sp. NPDC051500 TaxID=3363959 RepID=UPI0037A93B7A
MTSRATDIARWMRQSAEDPGSRAEMTDEVAEAWLAMPNEPLADPVREYADPDAMVPVDPHFLFFAGISRETRHLVGNLSVFSRHGASEIGGAIHREFRRQGYGHEMLETVTALAHRHFGLERLVAGAEPANTASRHWLGRSGFTPADGPDTVTLESGRTVQTVWFEHVDPEYELRCTRPRPTFRKRRRQVRRTR